MSRSLLARTILDPFAGTGTTPLVATRLGLCAYCCELNPLLQQLIEATRGVMHNLDAALRPAMIRNTCRPISWEQATRFYCSNFATGAALVASTCIYFLLFAQFAFLALTKSAAPNALPAVLGAQGLAGIAGSVLAACLFQPARMRALLATGLLLCAAAAGLAPFAGGAVALVLIAALTGLALGGTTVTLASSLLAIAGPAQLGLACGLGTGLAYALCSMPPVFNAAPGLQSFLAAGVACAGAGVAWLLSAGNNFSGSTAPSPDHEGRSVAAWVLIFLALVSFDSAAFYIIQNNPGLKAAAWSDPRWLFVAATGQLLAGVAAGRLLDRSRRGTVVIGALLLLAGAGLLLARPVGWISVLHAAGAALYSTALVHYPAQAARPRLAALIYAVCGWGGSAVGLGLAQGRQEVPLWLILVTAGLAGTALGFVPPHRAKNTLSSNR